MTGRGQEGTFPRPPAGPGSTALGGPSTSLPARLAGARARARRTRRSGRAGAAPGRTRRLSQGRAPAALSAPDRKARPQSPQTPAGHPHPRPPKSSPGSRRGLPRQVLGGAAPAPGANLGGERRGGRVPALRPLSSQSGTYPAAAATAAPRRQRAGLRRKESERETAPAAAWPVPAPRPPSPCRRERAGSAGPLDSGPIGRGGPRAQGRCRLQGQLHPLPTAGAAGRPRPLHAPRRHARRPRPPARAPSRYPGLPGRLAARLPGRR